MRCKGLNAEHAEALLRKWSQQPDDPFDALLFVQPFGDGEEMDEVAIEQAVAQMVEEVRRQKEGGRLVSTDAMSRNFDAMAAEVLHRALPAEASVVGRFEFWMWLAVTQLREVIVWRFPERLRGESAGGRLSTKPANFGLGPGRRNRVENYAYKLWVRAEAARVNDGGDAYRFARRGDVDFWTSHVLRQQGYASYGPVARALVRFQFPDELKGQPRLFPGQEKGEIRSMRTLAKLLKRLQANVEFVLLDERDLDTLIRQHATGLNTPDGEVFSG